MPLGNREGGQAMKRSQDISPGVQFPIKTLRYSENAVRAAVWLLCFVFRERHYWKYVSFSEILP